MTQDELNLLEKSGAIAQSVVDSIELSLAVGIVGGLATAHPLAHINLKILGVQSSQELAMVIASVGLAQNFAALRALVCEGIQYGHRQLHERKTKTYFVRSG